MRQRVHAGACGDEFWHPHAQSRIANDHGGHQFGVPDDLFLMRCGIGQNPRSANFRPGASGCWHRNRANDLGGIGPRPPIADIFHFPHGQRLILMRHQGNHLTQIKRRSATKPDDPIMPTRQKSGNAGRHIRLGRVGIHFGKYGTAQACGGKTA